MNIFPNTISLFSKLFTTSCLINQVLNSTYFCEKKKVMSGIN